MLCYKTGGVIVLSWGHYLRIPNWYASRSGIGRLQRNAQRPIRAILFLRPVVVSKTDPRFASFDRKSSATNLG